MDKGYLLERIRETVLLVRETDALARKHNDPALTLMAKSLHGVVCDLLNQAKDSGVPTEHLLKIGNAKTSASEKFYMKTTRLLADRLKKEDEYISKALAEGGLWIFVGEYSLGTSVYPFMGSTVLEDCETLELVAACGVSLDSYRSCWDGHDKESIQRMTIKEIRERMPDVKGAAIAIGKGKPVAVRKWSEMPSP